MQVSLELLKELQKCDNAAEIIAKAKAVGIDITEAQAQAVLGADVNADMNADELDSVAGGACPYAHDALPCPKCGSGEVIRHESGDYTCTNCNTAYEADGKIIQK